MEQELAEFLLQIKDVTQEIVFAGFGQPRDYLPPEHRDALMLCQLKAVDFLTEEGICHVCGQPFYAHNVDGSCVEDVS